MKTIFSILALGLTFKQSVAYWPDVSVKVGDTEPYGDACWQLTDAQDGKEGAVWSQSTVDISREFIVDAIIYVGDQNKQGADGLAVVFQAESNTAFADPGLGERKGYFTIPNAFAVEFDTFQNEGEGKQDEIRVIHTGSDGVNKTADLCNAYEPGTTCASGEPTVFASVKVGHNLENGKNHTTTITYKNGVLKVVEDHVLRVTLNIDIEALIGTSDVYYGFTAATGGSNNYHQACPICASSKLCDCEHDGSCRGDPHFKTWSGEKYDFHGVCDLVLMQDAQLGNGVGMDIHIRTKKTRVWSYIHSAAIQIGDDVLEVMGGADENRFWVNKVRGDAEEPISLSGYEVTFEEVNSKSRLFSIDLGTGAVEVRTWNGMVSVAVKGSSFLNFGDSLGLMGTFPAGQRVGRDRAAIDDVNAFGQEWQVTPSDPQLFHDIDGPQHPETCDVPASNDMRRRLGQSLISQQDAEIACSRVEPDNFDLCVFDVMATNDKDVAGAY